MGTASKLISVEISAIAKIGSTAIADVAKIGGDEVASDYSEFSFQFDGVDEEVESTLPDTYPVQRNFSFWYKHIAYWPTTTLQPFFCGNYPAGSPGSPRYSGGAGIQDNIVHWSLGTGFTSDASNQCWASGDPDEYGIDLTDGDWHHIFIYNDVVGTGTNRADIANTRIWVDGNDLTLIPAGGNAGSQFCRGFYETLKIGQGTNGGASPAGDLYINGYIDEFAYWTSTYIGDAAVTEIYNSGAPNDLNNLSNASDPTGWYRMGENADWNTSVAGEWFLEDQGTGGTDAESVNMEEEDKVADTPPS